MRKMRALKAIWGVFLRGTEVTFVLLVLLILLFVFRRQRFPGEWLESAASHVLPTNLVLHVGSASLGLRDGVRIEDLRLYDRLRENPLQAVISASQIDINPLTHAVTAVGLKYPRLPDSYYRPGNLEKNARVEGAFPELPPIRLELVRPEILGVAPERVTATVSTSASRLSFDSIRLTWPDQDQKMDLDGSCMVDLGRQQVRGEVKGLALQRHIRPMLVALDVPVSLPYFDAFTDVILPVPAFCGWQVNLVNNDFDLELQLHPTMGRYQNVPMKKADGRIHLHVYTRGTHLNYQTDVGPIDAVDHYGRDLHGSVAITGTNGYNRVCIDAKSALPMAELLRIGGFTGDYVGEEVFGKSQCQLEFRFPRAMTNNYEVLNGEGHLTVEDGRLMRMKGFMGLLELLADKVPGVSWFTDSTQASADYIIENGVVKSDNIYIEGSVFSIKMEGTFDAVRQSLNFVVRVQFAKKDTWYGKVLHPLTWPFTKLLLEFRLTGSPASPKWEYISVVDRVMEAVQ